MQECVRWQNPEPQGEEVFFTKGNLGQRAPAEGGRGPEQGWQPRGVRGAEPRSRCRVGGSGNARAGLLTPSEKMRAVAGRIYLVGEGSTGRAAWPKGKGTGLKSRGLGSYLALPLSFTDFVTLGKPRNVSGPQLSRLRNRTTRPANSQRRDDAVGTEERSEWWAGTF